MPASNVRNLTTKVTIRGSFVKIVDHFFTLDYFSLFLIDFVTVTGVNVTD